MPKKKTIISNHFRVQSRKAVVHAVMLLGGEASTADELDITRQAVYQWTVGTAIIPVQRAIEIESLLKKKVTAKKMRPDIF